MLRVLLFLHVFNPQGHEKRRGYFDDVGGTIDQGEQVLSYLLHRDLTLIDKFRTFLMKTDFSCSIITNVLSKDCDLFFLVPLYVNKKVGWRH